MYTVNTKFSLRDQGFSNALEIDELPRHRWYFVKEGFSPKLVEQAIAIDGVRPGEVLLDPFSGSGTVPLSGALCGLQTRSFEINPFLRFLSAAKLRQVPSEIFRTSSRNLLHALEKPVASPLEGFSTFTEGNRWDRWLFPRSVLRSFEAGRQKLAGVDAELRDLLQLALIGAAMDCCNATRDGKCLRYNKNWHNIQANASQFRRHFEKRAEIIEADLSTAPLDGTNTCVTEGDARKLIAAKSREKFRLCVTSPPYLNSFDYSDIYRPELFLGGFVDSNKSLMDVRLQTIRSHVQASWEKPITDQFGVIYRNSIDKIRESSEDLWNSRIPTMVQAYFEDMETIFRGLRQRAHKNASIWLVVSTSAYAGIEVPVDLILAEIGQRNGWFLREVGVLRYLRSSSQHVKHVDDVTKKAVPLRESVVIFDAARKSHKNNF
jgi:hypothetical protein